MWRIQRDWVGSLGTSSTKFQRVLSPRTRCSSLDTLFPPKMMRRKKRPRMIASRQVTPTTLERLITRINSGQSPTLKPSVILPIYYYIFILFSVFIHSFSAWFIAEHNAIFMIHCSHFYPSIYFSISAINRTEKRVQNQKARSLSRQSRFTTTWGPSSWIFVASMLLKMNRRYWAKQQ